MTAPPSAQPTQAHRRPVSVTVASQAASAIRRAGFDPNPGNTRWVVRAARAACERRAVVVAEMTESDWDRLVSAAPFARKRAKVRACDPRRDGWRQA